MALVTEIELTWLKIGLCKLGLNYMDLYIDMHCIESIASLTIIEWIQKTHQNSAQPNTTFWIKICILENNFFESQRVLQAENNCYASNFLENNFFESQQVLQAENNCNANNILENQYADQLFTS